MPTERRIVTRFNLVGFYLPRDLHFCDRRTRKAVYICGKLLGGLMERIPISGNNPPRLATSGNILANFPLFSGFMGPRDIVAKQG
jgi:hypothetical protein